MTAHLSTYIAGFGSAEVGNAAWTDCHAQCSRARTFSYPSDFDIEDESCTRREAAASATQPLLPETSTARRYRRLRSVIPRRSTTFRAHAFDEFGAVASLAIVGPFVSSMCLRDRKITPVADATAVSVSAH